MKLKELYKKYNMIIKYFLCSVSSSIIDFAILYVLKGVFDEIVVANTISIIVSSIFHYIVTYATCICFWCKVSFIVDMNKTVFQNE